MTSSDLLRAIVAAFDAEGTTRANSAAIHRIVAKWSVHGRQGAAISGDGIWICACPPGESRCSPILDRCEECGLGRPR